MGRRAAGGGEPRHRRGCRHLLGVVRTGGCLHRRRKYHDASKQDGAFVVSDGCQQVTLSDASYEVGGCVTEEDDGTLDLTDQQSNIDGVDVSASDADEVSYDDGGSEGNAVISAGTSTLSLDLDGTPIPVFTDTLDDQLTAPITVTATASAAATIAGLPISGRLTLTPSAGGTAEGRGTVTLPAALGGGKATLKFTTTVNKGLSNVTVTVTVTDAQVSFMQLFKVSRLTLTYAAGTGGTGTWTVGGTAASGGTTSSQFSGKLVYSGHTLTSAKLDVGKISLAGLTTVSSP
jgi:hypothetical protein